MFFNIPFSPYNVTGYRTTGWSWGIRLYTVTLAAHYILCNGPAISHCSVDMVASGMSRGDFNTSALLPKFGSLHPPLPSGSTPIVSHHQPTFTSSLVRPSSVQPQLDLSNWNATLSELHQSIQQVKEDLASTHRSQRRQDAAGHGASSKAKRHISHTDDELDISEHSTLSRGDLSSHTSRSTLVHS